MSSTNDLLGMSGLLTRARVEQLLEALSAAWFVSMERPLAALDDDLADLKRWYDPVAQGQRLRRDIATLQPFPVELDDPRSPFTVCVAPGIVLITPEGRCSIDLLENLPADRIEHLVTDDLLQPYERRLAHLYQNWSRHRLKSVVQLLAGTDKPLQMSAAGVIVALLVNRSTSRERALVRFRAEPRRTIVDQAFFAPILAFANVLAPSDRRTTSSSQLISGWILYEVRRRLGDSIELMEARSGSDGAVWIKADRLEEAIDIVARDLIRGHRGHPTLEEFGMAFDALVHEMRNQSSVLAGFGLAYERPTETQRLRGQFENRLRYYLSESA